MFVIQVGGNTKFKYELQGLFAIEIMNQSLNIKTYCSWSCLVHL